MSSTVYNLVEIASETSALFGPMGSVLPASHPESFEAIGKRLRALREALELSQDDLGAVLGTAKGSALLSPIERGKDRLGLDRALMLCRRYGVTLDWIYRGLWHAGMPFDLAEKIRFEEMRAAKPSRRS